MFTAPSETCLQACIQADALLRGADRRLFRSSIVKSLGRGAADYFLRTLGWALPAVRKGISELESGCVVPDDFKSRGRKPAEARLPDLEKHLRSMAEALSQTDPTFRTTQLYRRLTGKEARRRLIEDFGYSEADAPSERSLRRKLSALGYQPMKVRKSKPLRKIRETDAIFETVHRINAQAEAGAGTVRLSIDTKTTVRIGNLSRGGKSRRRMRRPITIWSRKPNSSPSASNARKPPRPGGASPPAARARTTWPTGCRNCGPRLKKRSSSAYPCDQRGQRAREQRRAHPVRCAGWRSSLRATARPCNWPASALSQQIQSRGARLRGAGEPLERRPSADHRSCAGDGREHDL